LSEAQGIEAEIPEALGTKAEELERIARSGRRPDAPKFTGLIVSEYQEARWSVERRCAGLLSGKEKSETGNQRGGAKKRYAGIPPYRAEA
jgi:hypothetical protein